VGVAGLHAFVLENLTRWQTHMKKILLVDDDQAFRSATGRGLRQSGYEVVEAPDGAQAFKLFDQQSFDLVITDVFMPEKEGLETIREIKARFPKLKVVAISGGGLMRAGDCLELAKMLGADGILRKPFNLPQLLEFLAKLEN
jgi:CheY-like chemotaxis protein